MAVDLLRPSGLVAFVFTDIEGSTALWDRDEGWMASAVEAHDGVIRATVAEFGGYVFATGGDGFGCAFHTPQPAVDCALGLQERLESSGLRVRVGVHVGAADERDGDYFGAAVNLAARVCDAGHGGQVLATSVVAETVGVELVSLGSHRLRGVADSVELWQVGGGDFPALRTLNVAETRLPSLRTSTVGRDELQVTTTEALVSARVVTLTGAGGSGKTRTAIEAAGAVVHRFLGGVFFVDLTTAGELGDVWGATHRALGLMGAGLAEDRVVEFLAERQALLVFDNCEQVLDEVAEVLEQLLDACPGVRVLATSREPIDLDGERVIRVPSLEGPDAVRLFVERAVDAGVAPGELDGEVVADVCRQLDGIPLAIELAAARTAALGLAEIHDRLDDRFRLLSGRRRGSRRRQQTLDGVLDWSFDLLDEQEQRMLLTLSVFAGGFDVADAAAVAQLSIGEAGELVESLVHKSLVDVVPIGGGRVDRRLLETVRLYGLDRLYQAEDLEELRRRHADYWCRDAFDLTLSGVRSISAEQGERELRRFANVEAAVNYLVDMGEVSTAAALVTYRSQAFVDAGRLSAYRGLFLDHDHSTSEWYGDILRCCGPWMAHSDFEVVFHLVEQARTAIDAGLVAPHGEILLGLLALQMFTEGVDAAFEQSERYLEGIDHSEPVSRSSLVAIRNSMLGGLGFVDEMITDAANAVAATVHTANTPIAVAGTVMTLAALGRTNEVRDLVDALPEPRPGGFAYITDQARIVAQLDYTSDDDVAAQLLELCSDWDTGRIPMIRGDLLVPFALLHARQGRWDRVDEILGGALVRLHGGPSLALLGIAQNWPDAERTQRCLALSQSMFVDRDARDTHNNTTLTEEIAHWSKIVAAQAPPATN